MNPGKTHERGTALVVALLFTIVLLGWVTAILMSGYAVHRQQRVSFAADGALDAAESGIHFAVNLLNRAPTDLLDEPEEHEQILSGEGLRAQRFVVRLESAAVDGVDNDADTVVDEPDEREMVEIVSTGWYDGVARTIRVTVTLAPPLRLPAAMYSHAAKEKIKAKQWANTLISGRDVDLEGNETGVEIPALMVGDDPDEILHKLRPQDYDRIVGAGGSPSVVKGPPMGEGLLDIIQRARQNADYDFGSHTKFDGGEFGTIDNPVIVVAHDKLHLKGSIKGYGLLVIDTGKNLKQELKLQGELVDWTGLIIIHGNKIKVGIKMDTFRVRGGIILDTHGFDDNDPKTKVGYKSEADLAEIQYSEAAVSWALQRMRTFRVINWREGPASPGEAP